MARKVVADPGFHPEFCHIVHVIAYWQHKNETIYEDEWTARALHGNPMQRQQLSDAVSGRVVHWGAAFLDIEHNYRVPWSIRREYNAFDGVFVLSQRPKCTLPL